MVQRISLIPASLAGAAALALTALPAAAHPSMHGCGGMGMGKPPIINVQGEGRASVAPDLATVSLGVTTQAPTAAQAMSDNAARQTAVIEALRAQGIAPADLQTQGLNLSPIQDFSRQGQPPVITGYQAQNIVTARIRDLARLGPLLDTMVAAGATDVQGVSFSREDAAATEDRARTEAVTEARRRAEVIAGAAGMELGPLVSLTDTSMSEGPRPMAMMARAADAEASTPVETGELTLTAQVTGVWSLVPTGGMGGDCGPRGRDQGPEGHRHGAPKGHHGMMPHDHMGDGAQPGPREGAPDMPAQPAPAPEALPPVAPQPGGDSAPSAAEPAPGSQPPAGQPGTPAPDGASGAPATPPAEDGSSAAPATPAPAMGDGAAASGSAATDRGAPATPPAGTPTPSN